MDKDNSRPKLEADWYQVRKHSPVFVHPWSVKRLLFAVVIGKIKNTIKRGPDYNSKVSMYLVAISMATDRERNS
jgi:hypothetical protein